MTLVRPKGLDPLAVLAMRIVRSLTCALCVWMWTSTPSPTAGVSLSLLERHDPCLDRPRTRGLRMQAKCLL